MECQKIRLIVVSAVIDPDLGGPAAVLKRHLRALREAGVQVTLFGVANKERLPLMRLLYPDARLFPIVHPKRWFRGGGFTQALRAAMDNCDVVHAHMLWDHSTWAAWRCTRRAGIPLIVTPHGSLMEPWRYRSLHKRLYRWLFVDPMLREIAFLHVLSQQEAMACQKAGVTTPLRVVANGLEKEEFGLNDQPPSDLAQHTQQLIQRWPVLANQKIVLYLGRLWEGKGVIDLVDAWAKVIGTPAAQGWILVLAGPDYKGFRVPLEQHLGQLGIGHRVLMTGAVFGIEKTALLAVASGFVLPSRSEGASMALLEAMAVGLALILTRECHFPELALAGGGIEVAMGVEGIASGLTQLFTMDSLMRQKMGQKAQSLALHYFTMTHIVQKLIAIYQEAINLNQTQHRYLNSDGLGVHSER